MERVLVIVEVILVEPFRPRKSLGSSLKGRANQYSYYFVEAFVQAVEARGFIVLYRDR
jgi:hypothetical protein